MQNENLRTLGPGCCAKNLFCVSWNCRHAAAGLAHYTTRLDQVKEMDDTAGAMVDIGLHYVATASSTTAQPKDTDGDGIPDFVEDTNGNGIVDNSETSPMLSHTVSGVFDPTNSVYDDVDLSGSGLVGRVKKALGIDPLDPVNPLVLTQIITGEEPDVVTFSVPINYATFTNIGELNLTSKGAHVTFDGCEPAADGNTLVRWNSVYDSPGQHYLQLKLTVYDSVAGRAVLSGCGPVVPFYSSNVVRFFENANHMFDDNGAYLDAKLAEQNANYTILLYDASTTPPTLIKTITNSAYDGVIQQQWDLSYDDGTNYFSGDTVHAVFYVTLAGSGRSGSAKKILKRAAGSLTEWGPNFDFVYMYTPTNNALQAAFDKNGTIWKGMQGVVDVLIKPAWPYEVYQSYFNRYLPDPRGEYPGYITRRTRRTNDPPTLPSITQTLFPDMTNGLTKQFYCYAHGSSNWIGNWAGDVYMTASEVAQLLRNTYKTKGPVEIDTKNPYRFVFLDGCSTALNKNWRRAFGIFPLDAQYQAAYSKVGPQAFVGWAGAHTGWLNGTDNSTDTLNVALAYTQTLQKFYSDWMRGIPLAQCIANASTPAANIAPFPVPKNKVVTIWGTGLWGPYRYTYTNVLTSDIYVIGHSGLAVDRSYPQYNRYYAAPATTE